MKNSFRQQNTKSKILSIFNLDLKTNGHETKSQYVEMEKGLVTDLYKALKSFENLYPNDNV